MSLPDRCALKRTFGLASLVEGELEGVGIESLQLAAHVGVETDGGFLGLERAADIIALQEIHDLLRIRDLRLVVVVFRLGDGFAELRTADLLLNLVDVGNR